jgi:ABC-type nitrate/sulfonate/bicarbonate transport system ATPase subunit
MHRELQDQRTLAPRISLRDLVLSYKRKGRQEIVLGPMSLEISAGQTVAIVGPSGCGKSSLLRSIIGELDPYSGTIFIDRSFKQKAKLSVVFQENTVFPWLTAKENVAYPLTLTGVSKRTREDKATEWLKRFGLEDSIDKYPSELSGGMLQRVALARALAHEPEFLILDEPFGQLDELTRLDLGLLLQSLLSRTNITTLLVTHSIDEAVLISSRILVLSKAPATLLLDLNNPLSESRQKETLTDKAFIDVRNKVLQTLLKDRE